MRKPFFINVFGMRIKVVYDHIRSIRTAGLWLTEKKVILIDSGLSKDYQDQVLVHEIGHAVFSRVGIEQAKIHKDVEDIIVDNIATAITENFHLVPKKK